MKDLKDRYKEAKDHNRNQTGGERKISPFHEEIDSVLGCRDIRDLTNRRLLHDAAVRLRDMLTTHAFLSTCQLRAKGDDVGESDLPASWKQEDVRLVFKVFSRYFGYFCQIITVSQ